ncbi:MAG: hypothetical protein ACO3AF_02245 [Flavobacteriales bacterium]|jgi:hypothetical protein|nr:hypothetical protein [Bacteroidota bacterium]
MKRWQRICILLFPPMYLGRARRSEQAWLAWGQVIFGCYLAALTALALSVFWHGGRWLPVLSGFFGG